MILIVSGTPTKAQSKTIGWTGEGTSSRSYAEETREYERQSRWIRDERISIEGERRRGENGGREQSAE